MVKCFQCFYFFNNLLFLRGGGSKSDDRQAWIINCMIILFNYFWHDLLFHCTFSRILINGLKVSWKLLKVCILWENMAINTTDVNAIKLIDKIGSWKTEKHWVIENHTFQKYSPQTNKSLESSVRHLWCGGILKQLTCKPPMIGTPRRSSSTEEGVN